MKIRTSHWFLLAAAIAMFSIGTIARAEETAPTVPADPDPAQRQQMAAIHRRMAECLTSDRPFADCRAEMHASCQTTLGAGGCPMMQGGGMGPGRMGGGGMHGGGMMQSTPKVDGSTP
jgi:hypothetical protein